MTSVHAAALPDRPAGCGAPDIRRGTLRRADAESGPLRSDNTSRIPFVTTEAHRLPCLGAAALCVAALAEWPYGYYQVLRWVVTLVAVGFAFYGYSRVRAIEAPDEKQWWSLAVMPAMVGLAILFNPIAPITMPRSDWAPLDLAAAVPFAVGFFVSFDLRRVEAGDRPYRSESWEPVQAGSSRVLPQTLGKWVVGVAILTALMMFALSAGSPGGDPDCVGFEPGEC